MNQLYSASASDLIKDAKSRFLLSSADLHLLKDLLLGGAPSTCYWRCAGHGAGGGRGHQQG